MTFKTLYDVLDGIRERPAMYLGPIVIEELGGRVVRIDGMLARNDGIGSFPK